MPASKRFPESQLAHQLLDGLTGLEVGASAHNGFGLNTINVDLYPPDPVGNPYTREQITLCGEWAAVDIIAPGNKIPVPDKSFDFVISSHVIEHFFDPIGALKEWVRIARKYIYIICPLHDALESDKGKLITGMQELLMRHAGDIPDPGTDEHHTRWTVETFIEMCNLQGWYVSHWQSRDDKVGNGFCVVIDLQPAQLYSETVFPAVDGKKLLDALDKATMKHRINKVKK